MDFNNCNKRFCLLDMNGIIKNNKILTLFTENKEELAIIRTFGTNHIVKEISRCCEPIYTSAIPKEINSMNFIPLNLNISDFKNRYFEPNPDENYILFETSEKKYDELFKPYRIFLENRDSIMDFQDLPSQIKNNLISIDDIKNIDGYSYSDLELQSESKTHYEMRIYSMQYFIEHKFKIIPRGVGIKNLYVVSDFLAFRNNRVIFVECLTDKNLTPQTIKKKLQLGKYGELYFVLVGGATTKTQKSLSKIKKFKDIGENIHFLFFIYGDYDYEKKISSNGDEINLYSDLENYNVLNFEFKTSRKYEIIIIKVNKNFNQSFIFNLFKNLSFDFVFFYLRENDYDIHGSYNHFPNKTGKKFYKRSGLNPISICLNENRLQFKYEKEFRNFILEGLKNNSEKFSFKEINKKA